MQRSMIAPSIALAIIASASGIAADDNILYEVNFTTGHRTSHITRAEAREVTRFVRTVDGISHHILLIDALDRPDVAVTTGDWSQDKGDVVYLRKERGRWTLRKKLHWRSEDGSTLECE